jgi:phage-related holin
MFAGKKTYIAAAVAVITAVAAYLVGDADLMDTIQLVITAVIGATLRNGIARA